MRLVVISHKPCWQSSSSSSGYATDGGFPFQMRAISELFDETRLVVPVKHDEHPVGEVGLSGQSLSVVPLSVPVGRNLGRKLLLSVWIVRNLPTIVKEIRAADAVHTPIPGDVGTIGLLVALILGRPLFVRYCGNWFIRRTFAEHFWGWLLERTAGDRTVVLATGGDQDPPSDRNPQVRWIFSSSLTESELKAYGSPRSCIVGNSPRLIICCRQERKKGTDIVIESLRLLQNEYPDISLDVVGDGASLGDFQRTAVRCGVSHRVRFHGKVHHEGVMALLKTADIFCFPTTSSEGFPKAVLEALACGLPVVTTPVSVLGELIGGGGGVVLSDANALEVARGIRWCFEDADRYYTLSSAAIRTAAQYSLERWRDSIASVLIPSWGQLRSANV